MTGRRLALVGALAVIGLVAPWGANVAIAQSVFGTHMWQMQPYCNVVTLTLSPAQDGARLEGFDNLCGSADRASAVGMASPSASGAVTLNFTLVTAPSGRPVHVTAVVSLLNGSGTWIDSGGNTGTMAYGAAAAGLPVRPIPVTQLGPDVITTLELAPGAVRVADINTAEVQARVSGSCPAGQAMSGINANGTVTCTAITGGGGGSNIAFKAGGNLQGNYLPTVIFSDVTWTSTRFSTGGGTFDGTSYTAPAAGVYLLTTSVPVAGGQTSGLFCGSFLVNNTEVGLTCDYYTVNPNIGTPSVSLSTTAQLSAGDTVKVSLLPFTPIRIDGSNAAEANFTVTKLQ